MVIELAEIGDILLYNEDLRATGLPAPVEPLRAQLAAVDAVLFVAPKYNFSISGVLKNAIDWASRSPILPFDGKPVAIMGASESLLGTARAQYQLRQMLVWLNVFPINKPEVFIGQAASKFDGEGRLTDEATRDFVRQLLEALEH